jgi:uncharacterized protein
MKVSFKAVVFLLILFTVFSLTYSQSNQKDKMEQDEIIKTVKTMFDGTDERNWPKVQSTMAESVLLDFSSMSGEAPSILASKQIAQNWAAFLPGFDKTHHQLSNFQVTQIGTIATVHYNGKADHFIGKEVWTVEGTYDTELSISNGNWVITKHKLNLTKQIGNKSLPAQAIEITKARTIRKVQFKSEGLVLKGNLHLPIGFSESKKYKGIVVTGSWTTVKEQMPDLYAAKLAKSGFLALTFDFRYFGESEGQPREYENPTDKIKDIQNAVSYLTTLSFVDANELAGLAICASTGYMSYAAAQDKRIKTIVLIAPWLHNAELVETIYGSRPDGIKGLIKKSESDSNQFVTTGNSTHVLGASTTDINAAMFTPSSYNFDYYLNPEKGAIPEWKNNFALMSWKPWLTFDGVAAAKKIEQPVYIIHSESGAVPQGAKQYYSLLRGEKDIVWLNQYTQLDLYIVPQAVKDASDLAGKWFKKHLK